MGKRITSIDALRAITLLGILLVHCSGLFGFNNSENSFFYFTNLDKKLASLIVIVFSGRCSSIFSMLFGVSFFLILRNPINSIWKFVWRCSLLFMWGIFLKIFYTYDALMWYGINGILLVFFRNFSNKKLLIISISLFLLSIILAHYRIGILCFGEVSERYVSTFSLGNIMDYSIIQSIIDYLRIVFNAGVFKTLSYFLLGYYFAKKGIIDKLEYYAKPKNIFYLGLIYIFFFFLGYTSHLPFFLYWCNLFGALFYAVFFIFIYNKYSNYLRWLESYGKLGLTNYSFQGIVGVVFMTSLFIPFRFNFILILCCFIVYYIIQLFFSMVWLHYFKYGPLEWCWRCLTNFQFIAMLKK